MLLWAVRITNEYMSELSDRAWAFWARLRLSFCFSHGQIRRWLLNGVYLTFVSDGWDKYNAQLVGGFHAIGNWPFTWIPICSSGTICYAYAYAPLYFLLVVDLQHRNAARNSRGTEINLPNEIFAIYLNYYGFFSFFLSSPLVIQNAYRICLCFKSKISAIESYLIETMHTIDLI